MRIAFLLGEFSCSGKFFGTLPAARLAAAGHDVRCELAEPDLSLRTEHGRLVPNDTRYRDLDVAILIRPALRGLREFVRCLRANGTAVVHCIDDWVLSEGPRVGLYGGADGLREVVATYADADAFIASTPVIAENLAVYGKPVWVQGIAIWDAHYANLPPKDHSPDDEMVMGWNGVGWIRPYDLVQVRPVIQRLLATHPHVRFHAVGDLLTLEVLGIADHPHASAVPLVPLEQVPREIASRIDISLAPVARNEPNRAKTALKVMEAWGSGAVPVASAWQPEYARVIDHGRNGMLAQRPGEWYAALEALVTDRALYDRCRAGAAQAAPGVMASAHAAELTQMYEDLAAAVAPAALHRAG